MGHLGTCPVPTTSCICHCFVNVTCTHCVLFSHPQGLANSHFDAIFFDSEILNLMEEALSSFEWSIRTVDFIKHRSHDQMTIAAKSKEPVDRYLLL